MSYVISAYLLTYLIPQFWSTLWLSLHNGCIQVILLFFFIEICDIAIQVEEGKERKEGWGGEGG